MKELIDFEEITNGAKKAAKEYQGIIDSLKEETRFLIAQMDELSHKVHSFDKGERHLSTFFISLTKKYWVWFALIFFSLLGCASIGFWSLERTLKSTYTKRQHLLDELAKDGKILMNTEDWAELQTYRDMIKKKNLPCLDERKLKKIIKRNQQSFIKQ